MQLAEPTLPQQEIVRRLQALKSAHGGAGRNDGSCDLRLRYVDVARYIGRSVSYVRALAFDELPMRAQEQLRLSRMFAAIDRGELQLVKEANQEPELRYGASRPARRDLKEERVSYGFEFTERGVKLRRV